MQLVRAACAAVHSGCLIGGMASSRSSKTTMSWRLAPVRRAASGSAAADRPQHGASCPVCRDPSGSVRPRRPPFGRDAGRVERRPAPVDLVGFAEAIEQERWCRRSQTPASCQSRSRRQQVMPVPQPISWGSISQGMPTLEHEDDAGQGGAIRHAGSTTLGLGWLGWQQRGDERPRVRR